MLTKRNLTRSAALTAVAPATKKPFPVEAQRRAPLGRLQDQGHSRRRAHLWSADRRELWRSASCSCERVSKSIAAFGELIQRI